MPSFAYGKKLRRPRDAISLVRLIGDIATGSVVDSVDDGNDPEAVKRGKLGGTIGGKVRAAKLSAEMRSAIARKAPAFPWKK